MLHFSPKLLRSLIKDNNRIFLFLDYDGTLTKIVSEPDKAELSPEVREVLKKVSQRPNIFLAIISGRSLDDIISKVRLKSILYAANHGLEIYDGKKKFTLKKIPSEFFLNLSSFKIKLRKYLSKTEGVIIEDKGSILAIHYRKVPQEKLRKFSKTFKKLLLAYKDKFNFARGKKVYEIRPPLNFSKKEAVFYLEKVLAKGKNDITIYIGDDLTDEDVFRALHPPDISIRIGKSKSSSAKYYLTRKELRDLLNYLACGK